MKSTCLNNITGVIVSTLTLIQSYARTARNQTCKANYEWPSEQTVQPKVIKDIYFSHKC